MKHALLERILKHDLDVRSRLLARREELAQMIAVSRRESALNQTYGKTRAVTAVMPRHHEQQGS
jgi:flagellar protein FliT